MNWPRLHILVTRPQQRAQGLIKALDAKQASVLLFPTLSIQAIDQPEKLQTQFENIHTIDWLFFISPNAVEHAMPAILKHHSLHDLPCQWGAVGAGTKDALLHYGVRDVTYPIDDVGANALLNALQTYDLKNKKCMVLKGNSGNEQLETGLHEYGATVIDVVCYQRVRTQDNPHPLAKAINEQRIDIIIITSGDALKALHALLPSPMQTLLADIPLLVISERIEKIAQSLGFHRIMLARDASDDAVVACIDTWVQQRSDNDNDQ